MQQEKRNALYVVMKGKYFQPHCYKVSLQLGKYG